MTTRTLPLALGIGALFATGASAFVCTRTPALGPSVFWPVRTVEVHPIGGGAEVGSAELVGVLERGASTWSAPDCADAVVVVGGPGQEPVAGFNWHAGAGSDRNENIVVFRNDTVGDPVDRWVHTLGALAITTVTFDANSGRLLDADIEVNDVAFDFTTCDPEAPGCTVSFDLENTLTHELGHVLGLDHPPNDAPGAFEATMFASASRGDVEKRSLADDDIAGLCTLYPAGDPVAGECYGVGRPAPSTIRFEQAACAAVGPGWMPLLALGLLLRWRRRTV
jgi:MYXO-CTERM domain-containing protein